ncbi:hypothetical protein [Archaeoglobus sp.]
MKKLLLALVLIGAVFYLSPRAGFLEGSQYSTTTTSEEKGFTSMLTVTAKTPPPIPEPYYTNKTSNLGFADLVKFIMRNEVPHQYVRDYFDCSEMSAYYEWKLENAGFDTKILTGYVSFKRWSYEKGRIVLKTYHAGLHAYLMVKTRDGTYFVDPANSIWGHQIPAIILPGNIKLPNKTVTTYNYYLTNKLFEIGLCQFYPTGGMYGGRGLWNPFNDPYMMCSAMGLKMISQLSNDYESYSTGYTAYEDIYEVVEDYKGVSEWDWWNVLGYPGG